MLMIRHYLSHPNQDLLESRSQSKFDSLLSWFKSNYLSTNESKTKVLPLGDDPPYYELFADHTTPPLEVVHDMKLLGLTIDSSLSFIAHIKSVCNKVNVTVSALKGIRKFIPPEAMLIFTRPLSCHTESTVLQSWLGYQLIFLINWNLLISALLELF